MFNHLVSSPLSHVRRRILSSVSTTTIITNTNTIVEKEKELLVQLSSEDFAKIQPLLTSSLSSSSSSSSSYSSVNALSYLASEFPSPSPLSSSSSSSSLSLNSTEQEEQALVQHLNLCKKVSDCLSNNTTGRRKQQMNSNNNKNSEKDSQPGISSFLEKAPLFLQVLSQKLLVLRETRETHQDALEDLIFNNTATMTSLRPIALGVFSSPLVTSKDIHIVLLRLKNLAQQEQTNNTTSNNNNSNEANNSMMTDSVRADIARILVLARQRIRQLVLSSQEQQKKLQEETAEKEKKKMNMKKVDDFDRLEKEFQEKAVIRECIDKIFTLTLHVQFSACAQHLEETMELVLDCDQLETHSSSLSSSSSSSSSTEISRSESTRTGGDVSVASKACYIASVLARRSSCGQEMKESLLRVLIPQCEFLSDRLIEAAERRKKQLEQEEEQEKQKDDEVVLSTALSFSERKEEADAALSHAFIAFSMLDQAEQVLSFVDKFKNYPSLFQQRRSHWTTAWALAKTATTTSNRKNNINNVSESIEILSNLARSRPQGWRGVPSRLRNVFYVVGSRIPLLPPESEKVEEHIQKWCRSICEMKCSSFRIDSEVVCATLLALDHHSCSSDSSFSSDSSSSFGYFVLKLSKILSVTGISFADACRIIDHLVLDLPNSEHLACKVTCVLRNALLQKSTTTSISTSKSNSESQQQEAFLLDGQLLLSLLQKTGGKVSNTSIISSSSSTSTQENQKHEFQNELPAWLSHLIRFPDLLLPGALPNFVSSIVREKLNQLNRSQQKREVPSVVKALASLCQEVWKQEVQRNNNSNNNNDDNNNSKFNPLWTCQLCSTSNTYIHSSCGNQPCKALRHSLLQCNNCSFINSSCAESCAVCSSRFSSALSSSSSVTTTTPVPFGVWRCTECGTKNQPNTTATSGIRCESCSAITGPLGQHLLFTPEQLQERVCNACGKTPSEQDLISSQDPVCPSCSSNLSGLLLPRHSCEGNSHSSSSSLNLSCWNCALCGMKNPSFRERCAKCVHVSCFTKVNNKQQDENQTERFGVWSCNCGNAPTNSTASSSCSACGGSIEMNCASIYCSSSSSSSNSTTASSSNSSSQSTNKETTTTLNLSKCSTCGKSSSSPPLLLNKKSSTVSLSNKNAHSPQHFGDCCTNPSCGSLLPMSTVVEEQYEVERHMKAKKNRASKSGNEIEEEEEEEEVNLTKTLFEEEKEEDEKLTNKKTMLTSTPGNFFSSDKFKQLSFLHNLYHLRSLFSSLSSSSTSSSSTSDSTAIDKTIHRLIRICASRCSSSSSSKAREKGEEELELEEQKKIKSLVSEIVQNSFKIWNVQSDAHTRASLAAAVRLAKHFSSPSSSSSSSSQIENDNQDQQEQQLNLFLQNRCQYCLGTHPEELCPRNPNQSPTWTCDECGEVANDTREGAQRYVCKSCLGVRQEVLELVEDDSLWAEVWECPNCNRATPLLEDACIFCPYIRNSASNKNSENQQEEGGGEKETEELTLLPFLPARCGICSEVHFEALCAICARDENMNHKTTLKNALGLVTSVFFNNNNKNAWKNLKSEEGGNKFISKSNSSQIVATVQPNGTASRSAMVLVPSSVTRAGNLSVGNTVRFDARRQHQLHQHQHHQENEENEHQAVGDSLVQVVDDEVISSAFCATHVVVLH